MTDRITPAETLRRVLDSRLTDLHTALPGRVRSYDVSTQTADVEPMIKRGVPTGGEEDAIDLETLPVLPSVPVLFPTGGNCFVTFPLAVGDPVLIVFCERDTNHFRATGAVSDPGVPTMHGLGGAVAIPCAIGPRSAALPGVSSTDMVLGRVNGLANVTIKAAAVEVGGATDSAVLDSLIQAELVKIATAFSTFVPGSGGANFPAAYGTPANPRGSTASTRLKVGG
jgi:hypothetical protein